jgi:hypothetical protein
MRRLILIIALWLFLGGAAQAQVGPGKIFDNEMHGYWSSFMLSQPSLVRFRAIASSLTQPGQEQLWTLVDLFPPSCKAIFSFEFLFSPPLSANIPRRPLVINLRVDSRKLYVLNGSYEGVMGDSSGFINLNHTDQFSSLLADMRAGAVLRVQVNGMNGAVVTTASIPLVGFTYSLNRAQSMCSRFGRPKTPAPSASPFQTLPPAAPTIPAIPAPSGPQRPV